LLTQISTNMLDDLNAKSRDFDKSMPDVLSTRSDVRFTTLVSDWCSGKLTESVLETSLLTQLVLLSASTTNSELQVSTVALEQSYVLNDMEAFLQFGILVEYLRESVTLSDFSSHVCKY